VNGKSGGLVGWLPPPFAKRDDAQSRPLQETPFKQERYPRGNSENDQEDWQLVRDRISSLGNASPQVRDIKSEPDNDESPDCDAQSVGELAGKQFAE
jgi:hypothetical protein